MSKVLRRGKKPLRLTHVKGRKHKVAIVHYHCAHQRRRNENSNGVISNRTKHPLPTRPTVPRKHLKTILNNFKQHYWRQNKGQPLEMSLRILPKVTTHIESYSLIPHIGYNLILQFFMSSGICEKMDKSSVSWTFICIGYSEQRRQDEVWVDWHVIKCN